MLTSDLVRTEQRDGKVEPIYIDPDAKEVRRRAEELVDIFKFSEGEPQGKIDEAIEDITDTGTDYKIWRGLAKLLYDRSEFETVAPAEPGEIRRAVFEIAAETPGAVGEERREDVLAEAADKLGVSADKLDDSLYADLDERQQLTEFDTIEPEELIHRYNLALAQAVLYKATRLEVELKDLDPNRLRYLFQVLKFNRLMHRFWETDEGYRLEIDGPASLFSRNRKYGTRLATFLPAIVILDDWRVTARLDWEDKKAMFELSSDDGLVSHYSPRAQWKADEEKHLEDQFEDKNTDWSLTRQGALLELDDNQIIVPDYRLEHSDGRYCHLEIVGFWRLGYLERRIELLEDAESIPLVLAVSDRLQAGREALEASPASVFWFKTVILVDKVIEAADAVAVRSS